MTTRLERVVGEKRIPQGVVGRVVAIRDAGFDVLVTGFGVVQYARDELLPRRPGQVRFAERRAADWEVLRPCVVLEATVGSRAWGLADDGSDTDLRGVFRDGRHLAAGRARVRRCASARRGEAQR